MGVRENEGNKGVGQGNEHKGDDVKEMTFVLEFCQTIIIIQHRCKRTRAVFLQRADTVSGMRRTRASRRAGTIHVIKIGFNRPRIVFL